MSSRTCFYCKYGFLLILEQHCCHTKIALSGLRLSTYLHISVYFHAVVLLFTTWLLRGVILCVQASQVIKLTTLSQMEKQQAAVYNSRLNMCSFSSGDRLGRCFLAQGNPSSLTAFQIHLTPGRSLRLLVKGLMGKFTKCLTGSMAAKPPSKYWIQSM